jgi:anaerobic magnesium-protoporphyrin IX monomethyl ester cyclase
MKNMSKVNNKKFKVAISYPPLPSEKGVPCLGQNRQFQWFANPTYIYPMVPAYAASLLKEKGYQVLWDDAIAEELTPDQWIKRLIKFKPDLILLETKTPVVKRHWEVIKEIKKHLPKTKVILAGDHVTAMPRESMQKSKVDFVITGGDFDFVLLNIVNHLTKKEKLESGIWYRKVNKILNTGHFLLNHNLDDLPLIDRELTKWQLYAYKNGNYYRTPGTYIFSARDCWWGKCSFCSWTTIYPGKDFRKHTAKRMLDEVEQLVNKYKVKEIMDDSGTLPVGLWLKEFCEGMIERGLNKKVRLSCNMRFNALSKKEYQLMNKAGFRFILYGLESGNQKTLDRINKNSKLNYIERSLRWAKNAGLSPHVTTMIGYPWETKAEAQKTIDMTKKVFNLGLVDTMQATVLIPYPGTPLFKECEENDWLLTKNWDDYDQRSQIMKSELSSEEALNMTRSLYLGAVTPKFLVRKVLSIRSFEDITKIYWQGMKFLGKVMDFSYKKK